MLLSRELEGTGVHINTHHTRTRTVDCVPVPLLSSSPVLTMVLCNLSWVFSYQHINYFLVTVFKHG